MRKLQKYFCSKKYSLISPTCEMDNLSKKEQEYVLSTLHNFMGKQYSIIHDVLNKKMDELKKAQET